MRDFIAHQPPSWHMLKFHDSEPMAESGISGDVGEAVRSTFESDDRKFGEYLVLQIAEGGAYVLELATCDVLPLLDCSSKHFSSSLEYNKN